MEVKGEGVSTSQFRERRRFENVHLGTRKVLMDQILPDWKAAEIVQERA